MARCILLRFRLSLLSLLALGCATVPIGTFDLDEWRRTELEGVSVYSAPGAPNAEAVVRDVEGFVRLVQELVFQSELRPRRPARLFLFARDEQFRHFSRPGVAGHAVPGDDAFVIAQSLESAQVATLQHELVHLLLLNQEGASYPAWFHEGLAQFLGTAVIRSQVATVGLRPGGARAVLQRLLPFPLERLLASASALQPRGRDTSRFYADAWGFVHYGLVSHGMGGPHRAETFLRYVDAVSRGALWDAAFEESFGATLEEVEAEYRAHRRLLAVRVTHPQVHLDLGTPAEEVALEPVEAAEMVRELGSYALALGRRKARLAEALFEKVLAEDPADAAARIGRVRAATLRGHLERAETFWDEVPAADRGLLAARMASAELAHERYTALGARAPRADGARLLERARRGYTEVLAAVPDHRSAMLGFADTYLEDPEPPDLATPLAVLERGARLYPRDPRIRLALGRLHFEEERFDAARPHLHFVAEAYPGSEPARKAEDLLARIPEASARVRR